MPDKQRWMYAVLLLTGIACGFAISFLPSAQAQGDGDPDMQGRYDGSFGFVAGGLGGMSMTVIDRDTNTAYLYIAPNRNLRDRSDENEDAEDEQDAPPTFHLAATFDLTTAGEPRLDVQWEDPPEGL